MGIVIEIWYDIQIAGGGSATMLLVVGVSTLSAAIFAVNVIKNRLANSPEVDLDTFQARISKGTEN